MDEAEFGVNDISEEEYKRLKEKTMAKKKSMKKKKTKKKKRTSYWHASHSFLLSTTTDLSHLQSKQEHTP